MKLKGTLLLTLISLLERFSYYGIRAVIILYVISENAFDLNISGSSPYVEYWTWMLLFSSILFGFMTDAFIGQKRSIYAGGFFSFAGFLLMLIHSEFALLAGILLILIGTSLIKPSTTVLIGRQFRKEDKNRALALMVLFLGINIGAFFGILVIGYVG